MGRSLQNPTRPGQGAVFAGSRVGKAWPGLTVDYAWLPPFHGAAPTRPNRLEVVFSSHPSVALEQDRVTHDVQVHAGGFYVVGAEPTTLLRVGEYSDTLEMYPDMSLLRSAAERANISNFELEPTLRGGRPAMLCRDPVALGIAHLLRRACMNSITLSDIEASDAAHMLAARVLKNQHGIRPRFGRAAALGDRALGMLAEYIESNLEKSITIDALARLVNMSPFHFSRCFRRTTGQAPHQYVLARRIDLAKRLTITSGLPVQEIAWAIGFENISHFRRQFHAHFGVTPGELRAQVAVHRSPTQ